MEKEKDILEIRIKNICDGDYYPRNYRYYTIEEVEIMSMLSITLDL